MRKYDNSELNHPSYIIYKTFFAKMIDHLNVLRVLFLLLVAGAVELSSDANIHCVMGIIFDCLILSNGLICSIIYVLIDDVFRPRCLQPISLLLSPVIG